MVSLKFSIIDNSSLHGEELSARSAEVALSLARENFPDAGIAELAHKPSGQPFFVGLNGEECAGICVSISHSGAGVLVGISGRPIGVDIEEAKPLREPVLRRAYSAHERAYVEAAKDKDAAFLEIWTRKEAFAKASSDEGIRLGLMTTVCDEYGTRPYITGKDGTKWRLKTYDGIEGYTVSVCVPAEGGSGLPTFLLSE